MPLLHPAVVISAIRKQLKSMTDKGFISRRDPAGNLDASETNLSKVNFRGGYIYRSLQSVSVGAHFPMQEIRIC